jgi:hypothetical protein
LTDAKNILLCVCGWVLDALIAQAPGDVLENVDNLLERDGTLRRVADAEATGWCPHKVREVSHGRRVEGSRERRQNWISVASARTTQICAKIHCCQGAGTGYREQGHKRRGLRLWHPARVQVGTQVGWRKRPYVTADCGDKGSCLSIGSHSIFHDRRRPGWMRGCC